MIKFLENTFALSEEGARAILKASIYTFISNICTISAPVCFFFFLDRLVAGALPSTPLFIALGLAVLAVTYLLQRVIYDATYTATYMESERLHIEMCDRAQKLPMSYFAHHSLTEISQAITTDIQCLEMLYSHALPKLLGGVAFAIAAAIMFIAGNVCLGLCACIPFIGVGVIQGASRYFQKKQATYFYDKKAQLSKELQEFIEMHKEIQSYNMSEQRKKALFDLLEDAEQTHTKSEFLNAIFAILPAIICYTTIGLMVFLGGYLYILGSVSLLYVIGYTLVSAHLIGIALELNLFLQMCFFFDANIQKILYFKNMKLPDYKHHVAFDNFDVLVRDVNFQYNDDRKILQDVSFTAPQGHVTALVGPSGCGKTTMLKLLAKLFEPDSGSISFGDQNITDCAPEDVYKAISIVFQDVVLFNSSIYENILVGNKNASREEVMRAAKLANCEEFINKLPEGFDTLVGENGCNLSGGERQRLSIARAFLKDSPIIILDEIASNLDIDNEYAIQSSLQKLIKNKTTIIISHRMKAIENAHHIVVMNEGGIVAVGTHAELLDGCSLYREMIQKSELTSEFVY